MSDGRSSPAGSDRAAWTGGQYSLFRILLGGYLCVHFAMLAPWGAEVFSSRGVLPEGSASPLLRLFPNVLALWDGPVFVTVLIAGAALLSVGLAAGIADRAIAVALWYVLACLFGRNPLTANPSLPFVGWLLLAHALVPPAPWGSLAARGRVDPGGAFRLPRGLHAAAWVVMAAGYTYSGITKLASPSWIDGTALVRVLENPLARPGWLREALLAAPDALLRASTWGALALELLFAPLALVGKLRPWLWGAMLAMHVGLLAVIDFADLSFGMILLHAFTFDPAWVRGRDPGTVDRVFYDGHCALCHGFIRFLLAEDREGAIRFSPLEGDTIRAMVTDAERARLPDSVAVRTASGVVLTKSAGVIHVLARLGGAWRVLGGAIRLVPAAVRDRVYDAIASVRRRVFGRTDAACPVLPPALRARFDP